jgi:antagonist of KipI
MSILVQKSGLLSTVQDLGRKNFRRFGINPNGAMDKRAARLINILLGNDEAEGVLEMHFPAPVFQFEKAAIVALGGADFGARLNDLKIENWRPVFVEKGSVLKFAEKVSGNRAYLSVKGGLSIEQWLGSFSTNLRAGVGGFSGRSLQKDDRIFFNGKWKTENAKFLEQSKFPYKISNDMIPRYSSNPTVRVVAGTEFERLTALGERRFLNENFTISRNSDRMGFRLTGAPLYLLDKIEMVSSAVDFGAIQLLPDGQMIILMADHQTSGGYPRIAHVASVDLPVLAQLGANDKVNFEIVSIEEAENLLLEFEKDLNLLRIACSFKNNS